MTNEKTLKGVGLISTKVDSMSIQAIQNRRKKSNVVIIETNCGVEIVCGIRADVIKSAYETSGYKKHIYHWPVKKGRHFEDVIVLCDMKTGDYSLIKGDAVKEVKDDIPEGFKVEFISYYEPKKTN